MNNQFAFSNSAQIFMDYPFVDTRVNTEFLERDELPRLFIEALHHRPVHVSGGSFLSPHDQHDVFDVQYYPLWPGDFL